MSIESRVPPQDDLFEDELNLGDTSLSELYLDALASSFARSGEEMPRPWPVYAARGDVYVHEYGITIKPETFHQAADFGDKAKDIIGVATEHHERLRELGIKVVGHAFEPVSTRDRAFQTHLKKYPTILVGTKYLAKGVRESDRVEGEGEDSEVGGTLTRFEEFGLTVDDLKTGFLDHIKEYYLWCKSSRQDYVLSDLNDLFSYLYHRRQDAIALQKVSTDMGRIHFPGDLAPVGNLWGRARSFEKFYESITGEATELPIDHTDS